ncbi:ATPase family associated with various cellular activities (AAA) [Lentzea xinjiangensis]|uniref:ATPase family associated with various cellular activities (AAA) n=1 Tax=Lentzea xinjiangensis TaxID=402600 RepID=A0A1H9AVP8_9PSEU|nr:DNA repair ATPase [Lentzea xinjiangensis]SEP80882.1 ATPase family associated with various cellular activities (AAA) [Lentzea xinjiangensis]
MTTSTPPGLDAGAYEVLRARLADQAGALARSTEALNARRVETFGSTAFELVATERVRTENNCVPRDIVALGDVMLFGYNVFMGLKPETAVSDVFAVHDRDFGAVEAEFLRDPGFRSDFAELYRYYRETRLLQLRVVESRLLAVFQTGARIEDIRVLRWDVKVDGTVTYVDNRGDRDHVFPPSHDFTWVETTREQHVLGRHPHIAIDDEVFVETVGGTLTVKVENNTESGEGVYSEPVDEPLQSLADADVHYARVGPLVLLRILPYKETAWRHLVFNTRTKAVARLDGIGQACQRLPEDQGIIFPGGYYLVTGGEKTFDVDTDDLEFERVVRSANGEDVLYVFHARREGRSLLLPYNVIRKEVATPLVCHGYSLFADGTLVIFRETGSEAVRVHPMQVWRTPFLADEVLPEQAGPLARIGNAELVRGISDCLSITRTVAGTTPSTPVFESLIALCTRVVDGVHWLDELGLKQDVQAIRATAEQVLDEFEAVRALTEHAAGQLGQAAEKLASLIRLARSAAPRSADEWVRLLADLRSAQGRLITLRDLRYVDLEEIDRREAELVEELGAAARRAVEFLSAEGAFSAYHEEIEQIAAAELRTAAEAEPLRERLARQQAGLEVLTEVVSTLDAADTTTRTAILASIGEVLAAVNRARAAVDGRRALLANAEGRAEFAAEFALLGQAITGALSVADTPQRCADQLGRLLLQLENLESRFGEFDDFLAQVDAKRTDVYEAFSARKQTLLDERARKADRLVQSAERVLGTIRRRVGKLTSTDEINTYFAGDPMVAKVRTVAGQLRELGDVRADELDAGLRDARQEGGRALRDRADLYDGASIVLGRHRFPVTTEPVDLTLVPRDGRMFYAVTGTDYRGEVTDPAFAATKPFWDQLLVSETQDVYRSEHLAGCLLAEGRADVADAAAERYDEGYERGVHDHDAEKILAVLLRLHAGAGLLRYPPAARAAAQIFWSEQPEERRAVWARKAESLARARTIFGGTHGIAELTAQFGIDDLAAEYLFEELACEPRGFVTSKAARAVIDRFHAVVAEDLRDRDLIEAWLRAFLGEEDCPEFPEVVAVLLTDLPRYDSSAALTGTATGLLGTHPRIENRTMQVRLDETLTRLRRFATEQVPAFRAYQRRRDELLAAERRRLRLDDYRPAVLNTFVRNRLLNEVYLPLIGDNLAKQLGDGTGLLMLISPPGYGKTTLMEYVANRLGMVFVKVNGPALGTGVTSLDPQEAPNATARQEVERINFAFALGSNVLLHLDDIQHTSPELLQKFISLCDAQRRVDGVWDGEARTFDLRGKRFAVSMAGNPYTGTGRAFRVPDMLANRADVWNLGDVLSGREDLFALSYLENASGSNPTLNGVDVEPLVRLANGENVRHGHQGAELERMLSVVGKLRRIQEVVLEVNRHYIASAASGGSFLLQGSYRNMNRMAARVVPAMNDDEVEALIDDHYLGEAQLLGALAEANLGTLRELKARSRA